MRYICIDPGVTTGVAIFTFDDSWNGGEQPKCSLFATQFTDNDWIYGLNLANKDVVIMENYHIPIGKYFHGGGIETTGAVKAWIKKCKCKLIMQHMSVPSFISKRYAKELEGIKLPIHSREAMYHGLFYLRNVYNIKDLFDNIRTERGLICLK